MHIYNQGVHMLFVYTKRVQRTLKKLLEALEKKRDQNQTHAGYPINI